MRRLSGIRSKDVVVYHIDGSETIGVFKEHDDYGVYMLEQQPTLNLTKTKSVIEKDVFIPYNSIRKLALVDVVVKVVTGEKDI